MDKSDKHKTNKWIRDDNSIIAIIKIFDDTKIWDADNRNVKLIMIVGKNIL